MPYYEVTQVTTKTTVYLVEAKDSHRALMRMEDGNKALGSFIEYTRVLTDEEWSVREKVYDTS